MDNSIKVHNQRTSSSDGSDIWVALTTPTPGWEVQLSKISESRSSGVSTREDEVLLVNRKEQLQFLVGRKHEIARFNDGTWEESFFPDLKKVPAGLSVEIENTDRRTTDD